MSKKGTESPQITKRKKRKHEELDDIDDTSATNPPKRIRLTEGKDNDTNHTINTKEKKNNSKNDIFNGKNPKSFSVKELKELCRKNKLKVGGNKTTLIERLSNPHKITSKSVGGRRLSVQKVHKMLAEQGVKKPKSVSNCLKRGIQKGHVIIDSEESLDKILLKSACICCNKMHNVSIRDVLYQQDYAGTDYEEGGSEAEVQCEDCCGLYVTNICEGKPNFDSGKFHNHCTECAGFGKCIGDYREAHCDQCNKHYFAGFVSSFGCNYCERRRGGGGGGDGEQDDCLVQ